MMYYILVFILISFLFQETKRRDKRDIKRSLYSLASRLQYGLDVLKRQYVTKYFNNLYTNLHQAKDFQRSAEHALMDIISDIDTRINGRRMNTNDR